MDHCKNMEHYYYGRVQVGELKPRIILIFHSHRLDVSLLRMLFSTLIIGGNGCKVSLT